MNAESIQVERRPRLKLSRWVAAESVGDREVVVFHSVTQARLKLSRPVYDLILRFRQPKPLGEVVGDDPAASVRETIDRLLSKSFLVDTEENPHDEAPQGQRLLTRTTRTLFKCPAQRLDEAATDVVVVGAPSDVGTRTSPGMRLGPDEIRTRSGDFDYRLSVDTGAPEGWFEVDPGQRILAGVTFADVGNVVTTAGESPDDLFARIGDVVDQIRQKPALPLLLGGDHSLSYAAIRAVQAREPLAVLYLDAHSDADPTVPAAVVNHSCLALRLRRLPGVRKTILVGHRGYALRDKAAETPEGVDMITVPRWRAEGAEVLLSALPADLPCYVSIDVNVLDPTVAPGTSQPSPGGFTLDELKRILGVVGQERRVVGFDVMEVNPARDAGFITSIVACHLVLSGLGAVFLRRG